MMSTRKKLNCKPRTISCDHGPTMFSVTYYHKRFRCSDAQKKTLKFREEGEKLLKDAKEQYYYHILHGILETKMKEAFLAKKKVGDPVKSSVQYIALWMSVLTKPDRIARQ
uniref:Transposase n=1 Tax=Rhabditophanes sp. KR3021 TaxID=114890 RepID=A0AC35UD45_9BILA